MDPGKKEKKRIECPYCGERIKPNAMICKNCYLETKEFDNYLDLKKKVEKNPSDYILLKKLCEIYQNLRDKSKSGREERVDSIPAFYKESIENNERLFEQEEFEKTTVFLTKYYQEKGKYEKSMLTILWKYITINFEEIFQESKNIEEQNWNKLFLNFSNIYEFLDDLVNKLIMESSDYKKEKVSTVLNTIISVLNDSPNKKFKNYKILNPLELLSKFKNHFKIDKNQIRNEEKKKKLEEHIKKIIEKIHFAIEDFDYLTKLNEDEVCINFLHLPLKRQQKIKENFQIIIAIAATANTGKSSLINLLMKNEFAEVKNFPGVWSSGKQQNNKYETEIGIVFKDTPGLGSIKNGSEEHKRIAMQEVKNSDFVYSVFDVKAAFKKGDYGGDENDYEYYEKIKENNPNTYFILNKIDLCTEKEKADALDDIKNKIKDREYPISAITGEGISDVIKATIENIEDIDFRNSLIFYLNKYLHQEMLKNEFFKIVIGYTVVSLVEESKVKTDKLFEYNRIYFLLAVVYDCLKLVVIPNEIKKTIYHKFCKAITNKINKKKFENNFDFLCFGLAAGFTLTQEYLPYIENKYSKLKQERLNDQLKEIPKRIDNQFNKYKKLLNTSEKRIIKNIKQKEIANIIMTLLVYLKK